MNTFDRHLLREWLQILALVLAATCGLLVAQVLYEEFRELRELGARGLMLWEYVGVKVPSFLAAVLPLALLVSLLYTLGKLHRANEITAMRAAGVGFTRLTAPVWIVGLAFCWATWWLNTNVVPWSVERSRAIKEELQFAREANRGERADQIAQRSRELVADAVQHRKGIAALGLAKQQRRLRVGGLLGRSIDGFRLEAHWITRLVK